MTHPDAEALVQSYRVTHDIIKLQADGLTHKDSLLQPPVRGNCLNWVFDFSVSKGDNGQGPGARDHLASRLHRLSEGKRSL